MSNTTTTKKSRKGSPRKQAKAKTTKTETRKAAPVDDPEIEIDRIEHEHGETGNAAKNFFYTINYSPAFLRAATLDALARAAAQLNLPPFTDEGDDVEQFTRLVNLFEATGDNFTLNTDDTPEQRARNFVNYFASPKHDFLNDALVDAMYDAAKANKLECPTLDNVKFVASFLSLVPENFSLRAAKKGDRKR